MHAKVHGQLRGHFVGIGPLLLPYGYRGLNSGGQAWQQALLSPELSCHLAAITDVLFCLSVCVRQVSLDNPGGLKLASPPKCWDVSYPVHLESCCSCGPQFWSEKCVVWALPGNFCGVLSSWCHQMLTNSQRPFLQNIISIGIWRLDFRYLDAWGPFHAPCWCHYTFVTWMNTWSNLRHRTGYPAGRW